MTQPLPCGHPAECVVSGSEGTAYCGWCEEVARMRAELAESERPLHIAVTDEASAYAQRLASLEDSLAAEVVRRNEALARTERAEAECERLRRHAKWMAQRACSMCRALYGPGCGGPPAIAECPVAAYRRDYPLTPAEPGGEKPSPRPHRPPPPRRGPARPRQAGRAGVVDSA